MKKYNLYPIMDENDFSEIGFECQIIYEYENNGKNSLDIKKEDEILFFEDKRDLWREDKYNLCLNFSLRIKDHSLLFGDNKSVHEDSKIAIIVEVISRESRFRKVIKLTRFSKNQFNSNHGGTLVIEPRSLKGSFDVQVSFVIDEEIYTEKRFLPIANKKGIVVGTFLLQTITLEGQGSNFPVVNFHDKNAPLWHTRVLYDDIDEKPFNECITIALNVDHKNYCYIDEKNDKFIQAYLNEVVSSAIISILTELKHQKKIEQMNDEEYELNSTYRVLQYFMKTLKFDYQDSSTIHDSVKKFIDREMK